MDYSFVTYVTLYMVHPENEEVEESKGLRVEECPPVPNGTFGRGRMEQWRNFYKILKDKNG